jgi:hypothetical protein
MQTLVQYGPSLCFNFMQRTCVQQSMLTQNWYQPKAQIFRQAHFRLSGSGYCFFFLRWSRTESTITEATKWSIVPAAVDDEWWSMEQSVECLAGETEMLRENLFQLHFVHHKSHMTWAGTRAAAVGSWRLTTWVTVRPQATVSCWASEGFTTNMNTISPSNLVPAPQQAL